MVTALAGVHAQPGDGGVPWSTFEANRVFRPVLDRLWRSSATFRQQCHRLAGRGVRIRLHVEDLSRHPSSFTARSVIRHHNGSPAAADIYLRPSSDVEEMLAHELEHVLEQLDGVDLRAQAGNGVVWNNAPHVFETRRAVEVGRLIAHEIRTSADAHGARNRRDVRNAPNRQTGDDRPFELAEFQATLVQQDRDATPWSPRSARVSGDGRHIAFVSSARLVATDRNSLHDLYVQDLATGQLTLESVGRGAVPANSDSHTPDISRDGRYVVFTSAADNLSDTPIQPGARHIYLRDRREGTTRLLTTNAHGAAANGHSRNPAISADGAVAVFESTATDLLPEARDDTRGPGGIYLIHVTSGRRARLDIASDKRPLIGHAHSPAISGDGRFVVFVSKASVPAIYLRDTQEHTTTRIDRRHDGGAPDGASYHPAISADGRYVAFVSEATNIVRDATRRVAHVYVHDRVTGLTELVSRTPGGRPANGPSLLPALSHDGSRIAFQSLACDLLCEPDTCTRAAADINLLWDVFVYDRSARRMIRASADADAEWMANSRAPSLDASGHVLAFGSRHPIDEHDRGHDEDLCVYRLHP